MGMPRKPLAGGVLCLLLASGSGYARRIEAQSPSGRVPLAEAVQGIEKTLGAPNVSARERYAALARRARLFRLAGDLEGAARSWAEAGAEADGNSGNREAALLEAAFCLFALGELENAELAVKSAIESAKDREIIRRAIYLFAQIQVVRSGDLTPLSTLINNSDYERHKPGIYYFLWRYSGAGQYKNRLLSEYPESPEALWYESAGR